MIICDATRMPHRYSIVFDMEHDALYIFHASLQLVYGASRPARARAHGCAIRVNRM